MGAIKIALRLGEDRFYKYIRAFGFGQQTGIELPGETRGMTKPVSRWSKVSIGGDFHGAGDRDLAVATWRRWFRPLPMTECGSRRASWRPPASRRALRRRSRFIRQNEQRVISPHDRSRDEADDAGRGAARHGHEERFSRATVRPGRPAQRRKLIRRPERIRAPSTSRRLPDSRRSIILRSRWR